MPIEFRCSHCGKLLRTGDDTAGRQAQCPECGTIRVVPGSTAPDGPPVPPPSLPAGSNPFAAGPAVAGIEGAENPYRSPVTPAFGPQSGELSILAVQRVSGPAIALIVTAILGILANLGIAVLYGFVLAMVHGGHANEFGPQQDPAQLALGSGILVAGGIFGLLLSVIVLIGAVKMKNLKSYPFALTASIIAVVPCISPCCLLGLPFGIWAIMVLSDGSVRAAFQRQNQPKESIP